MIRDKMIEHIQNDLYNEHSQGMELLKIDFDELVMSYEGEIAELKRTIEEMTEIIEEMAEKMEQVTSR